MKKTKTISRRTLFFSMTLEFLETYMPRQLGRSPKTIKSYRDSLTIFRRYLHDEKGISIRKFHFEDFGARVIQDFIIFLRESGNSPGTCNQRLTAIRSYLWFAADRDVALQSVALVISGIPQCKVSDKQKAILSEEALNNIFRQPRQTRIGMRDRTMMILLYDSAIRLDELLSLTVRNLTLECGNPYIRVSGKGNKERVVAITSRTAEHLSLYLKTFHPDMDRNTLVFYTRIRGKTGKMSEGNVERFLAQYANQARETCPDMPPKVHPHMFRRTRATNLYQNGVEMALISRILGHSSIETTRIYATPSMEMLRSAIESVETPEQAREKPLWQNCSEKEMAKLCGLR
jgi:site-specific recombinase XerD